MFIYPTYFKRRITQINQFSYISTEFLHLYIHIFYYIWIINNNNHHGFFICIYIYIYICSPIFMCIYIFICFDLYFCFSHNISVDRPSRSQCVLNQLPNAAHTTITWITFCNIFMRFNQSNKFNIFISNVFYMVAYNWNTWDYTNIINNCIQYNNVRLCFALLSIDTNNCIQLLWTFVLYNNVISCMHFWYRIFVISYCIILCMWYNNYSR